MYIFQSKVIEEYLRVKQQYL